jgi:hypothetical protein
MFESAMLTFEFTSQQPHYCENDNASFDLVKRLVGDYI